jgi:DNA-binding transcriptional LysR family regulator
MKNFRDYYLFYHVYRNCGITKAADNLGVTNSTVSRAVGRLESEYGLKLFFRNGKGLYSTRFGDHLFQYCDKIIEVFYEAKYSSAKFKKECCGTIKIVAPVLFGQTLLSPIIAKFCNNFPKAQLHVCLSNDLPEADYPNYDIVFSLTSKVDDNFLVKKVGSIFTKLFWSPKYKNLDRNQMENNDFLVLTSRRPDQVFNLKIHKEDQASKVTEFQVVPKIISNDSRVIKEAVINGLGIGILPGHEVAKELQSGELEEAFGSHYVYHDDVYAIYSSFLMMPKLFTAFLDFVTVELSIDLQINCERYLR